METDFRHDIEEFEAEMTYLLIREHRPARVVELGCRATTWILRALRDNGSGRLLTMDTADDAYWAVPHELAPRWSFRRGDARALVKDWLQSVDHLVVDAGHCRFLDEIRLAPGTRVSVLG